ncbi:uncharacterized protein V1510DRAFT_426608 [Dipodascopsis tothii]|uniref:uncharacterized protein n=1 Tax=Dipodascopsis tothii TaxID=44089 RepID=UPI0034CDD87D
MSHGDKLSSLPAGFKTIGHTSNAPYAAIVHESKPVFGIQFHPEVTHTTKGKQLIENFAIGICGCAQNWTMENFIETEIERIRKMVGPTNEVIGAVSGGVDSTVAAKLLNEAIGERFHAIYVDNGVMRLNETEQVHATLTKHLGINLTVVDASDVFLGKLKGVTDPEKKRKIIGNTFIEIFEAESAKLDAASGGNIQYLLQGTLYPDVIESISFKGPSQTIKTHHNVGGLTENMKFKLIEPLRELFKDEVRALGTLMGIPHELVWRHPFPGPGIAIRVLGEVTPSQVEIARKADYIFIEEIRAAGLYDKISQAFACLLPVKSVGVMGDQRTYEQVIALRAIETVDFMTADWFPFDGEFLKRVSRRIVNEVPGVARVVYDVTPSAPTVGIESYVDELGGIQYDKTCGSARFMKTVKGRRKDGLVIVKIFIKPVANLSLVNYRKKLKDEARKLADVSHAIPYAAIVETERAGYLLRQYFGNMLYDRISTRPFLEGIEKRWIAFQLLVGLEQCHAKQVYHGDIKTENILVTSWNWVYLSDFASFKPTYLPEDDPADFSFFFDTSLRRICYVAPERFYGPGEKKQGSLTGAMDIFSLGCVIAELFLEGSPIFTLSQLFDYRRGKLAPDLSKIDDAEIRALVHHMISLDPAERLTATGYLDRFRNRAFPDYFYSSVHEYIQDITESSVVRYGKRMPTAQYVEADYRIERIYSEFDKIAYFLKLTDGIESAGAAVSVHDPIPVYLDIPNYHTNMPVARRRVPDDAGCLIFLAVVVSAIRNTATSTSRLHACDLILAFGERLPDEAKLDRCLPYLVALLDDDSVNVKVAAMRSLTQLMALVEVITPVNGNVFPEYILPRLQAFLGSRDVFVRANYASCIATIAETSLRFLDMAQALRADGTVPVVDPETENGVSSEAGYQGHFDLLRCELVNHLQDHAIALLTDHDAAVKRALLRSISALCAFFGSQKANDVILSHLITYLNDKDALLRGAFFDGIIGLAAFVGGNSLEEYIMPLMVQALADPEEFVIEKVLYAFTSLAELGLIKRPSLWDLVRIIVRFSVHPNLWIREGVFAFVAASTRWLSPADVHCIVTPIIRPFLRCDVLEYTELGLLEFSKPAISRVVFNTAVRWAAEAKNTNFWKQAREQRIFDVMPIFDGSYSIASSLHNLTIARPVAEYSEKIHRTEEDAFWLDKLQVLGLRENDVWKLVALREHVWRIAKSSNRYASARADFDPAAEISVKALGAQLHTYFFDDTKVVRRAADPAVSAHTRRRYSSATALMDALKTIDGSQRRASPSARTLGEYPPHWLNGAEGAPRTLGPVFQVESPARPHAASLFLTPSTSAATAAERAPGARDLADGLVPLEPFASAASSRFRRKPSLLLVGKAGSTSAKSGADVGTSPAYAYGRVDKPALDGRAESPPPPFDDDVYEPVARGYSYTGDDPYIIKLLDTVYKERILGDLPLFAPAVPLEPRPPALIKYGDAHAQRSWRPDGVLVAQFVEHTAPINRVVTSPDHYFFLTASDDGTVKVWDSTQLERNVTNRARKTYVHSTSARVRALCVLDSTYCFASGATDGSVHVVKIEFTPAVQPGIPKYGKLQPLRAYQLRAGEHAVWLESSRLEAGSVLLIATNRGRVLALDLRTMQPRFELQNPLHHGVPTCFCVDRRRRWLVVGTSRGVLDVWNLRFRVRIKSWGLRGGSPIRRIGLHPTQGLGKWICVAGGTNQNASELTVWDVEKAVCHEVYRTADASKEVDRPYEAYDVDADGTDGLLARLAADPADLLEGTEAAVSRGIRSMWIDTSSALVDWGASYGLYDDRAARHAAYSGGFVISAGADRHLRYWNLSKVESSSVFSGHDPDKARPTYSVVRAGGLNINMELRPVQSADDDLARQPTNASADATLTPSTTVSSSSSRRRVVLQQHQSQRLVAITNEQRNLAKSHYDSILDVTVLRRPYGLVVSVDRSGVIKVFS